MKKLSLAMLLIGIAAFATKSNAKSIWAIPQTTVIDSTKKVVLDPVCKMKVSTAGTKTTVYNKQSYYFCSESCKQKFVAEPSKYIKK